MEEFKKDPDYERRMEKHRKHKKTLRVIGIVGLTVGLACIIAGFVDFFSSISGFDPPKLFWLLFIGFPVTVGGGVCLLLSFRTEVTRYIKNEAVPVINEMSGEIKPALSNLSQAFRPEKKTSVCRVCGTANAPDANFCKQCAAPLKLVCPSCGKESEAGAKFCSACAAPLDPKKEGAFFD